jgi:LytS/YehU family sensor histidine kinase
MILQDLFQNFNSEPGFWMRVVAIILVAGSVYGYMYQRMRRMRKIEEERTEMNKRIAGMELRALRSQMNPHFIFNSLNSIQHLMMTGEIEKSQKYLTRFAKLMRSILNISRRSFVELADELQMLNLYLELESLRFGNQFRYIINVDGRLDTESCRIPSMLIQPFLENAIWHGLMHKDGGRLLELLISPEDNRPGRLLCVIQDNGIGRKSAMEHKSNTRQDGPSMGMEVTRERLEVMSAIDQKPYDLQISDLSDSKGMPSGTRVELRIPYNVSGRK